MRQSAETLSHAWYPVQLTASESSLTSSTFAGVERPSLTNYSYTEPASAFSMAPPHSGTLSLSEASLAPTFQPQHALPGAHSMAPMLPANTAPTSLHAGLFDTYAPRVHSTHSTLSMPLSVNSASNFCGLFASRNSPANMSNNPCSLTSPTVESSLLQGTKNTCMNNPNRPYSRPYSVIPQNQQLQVRKLSTESEQGPSSDPGTFSCLWTNCSAIFVAQKELVSLNNQFVDI